MMIAPPSLSRLATTRAWMLRAWPSVRWTPPLDPCDEQWALWRHVATVPVGRADGRLLRGESIWAMVTQGQAIGAAWEWVEWRPGVVVLRDPMGITSNLAKDSDPDPRGLAVNLSREIRLNTIAHSLPWQPEALRAIQRHRGAAVRPRLPSARTRAPV